MKALRVLDGRPTLVDEPEPAATGDDVEVRVAAVGICGSDLHLLANGWAEGRVLGHEISGRLADGTPVAIEPFRSCGHCAACIGGDRHRCDEGAAVYGIGIDGGMAESVVVPPDALVRLDASIPVGDASLVENLAVALHAVNRARLDPRDRVAVLGGGPIGLAVAAVLGRMGVWAQIGVRHDHQRTAAVRLGAEVLDDGDRRADGFDVVFDAVGNEASLRESIQRVRPRGRIVMVGSFWEPVAVDMGLLMVEAELVPAMMYGRTPDGREIDGAARLLAELPSLAGTLITHRFPLDAVDEAFAAARDRAAGAIKVVFEPGG